MRLIRSVAAALQLCPCCDQHRQQIAEAATVAALLHLAELDDAGMLSVIAQLERLKLGEAPTWTRC